MNQIASVQGTQHAQQTAPVAAAPTQAGPLDHALQASASEPSIQARMTGMPVSAPAVPLSEAHVAELNTQTATLTEALKTDETNASSPQEIVLPEGLEEQLLKVLDECKTLSNLTGAEAKTLRTPQNLTNLLTQLHGLDEALSKTPGTDALLAQLFETSNEVEKQLLSVTIRHELETILHDTAKLPLKEQLQEFSGLWAQVIDDERPNIAHSASAEGRMTQDDFDALNIALTTHVAKALAQESKERKWLTDLTADHRDALLHLAQKADYNPPELLDLLARIGDGLPPNMREEHVGAMLETLRATDVPAEILQCVDALFQGSSSDHSAAALQLKLALVPQENLREGIQAQHELTQASRALASILDTTPHKLGRHGVEQRAMNRQNAPSLVLTPGLTKKIAGSKLQDVNYYMAHLAMLQATAIKAGVINTKYAQEFDTGSKAHEDVLEGTSDADKEQQKQILATLAPDPKDMKKWCEDLGLDANAANHADQLAAELQNPDNEKTFDTMLTAARCYRMGLAGTTNAERVDNLVQKVGSMNTHHSSARMELALYSIAPHFLERRALDQLLIGLTGLVKDSEGLKDPKTGLTPDGDKIDSIIRAKVDTLRASSGGMQLLAPNGEKPDDISEDASQRVDAGKKQFDKNKKLADAIGKNTKDVVLLRGAYETAHASSKTNKADLKAERKTLQFVWPHQRAEQKSICRTLVEFGEIDDHITRLNQENDILIARLDLCESIGEASAIASSIGRIDAQLLSLTEKRDALVQDMATVDPKKLLRSKTPRDGIDAAFIRENMLPAARALNFFDSGEAKKISKDIRNQRFELLKTRLAVHTTTVQAQQACGPELTKMLRDTTCAALLKVCVELESTSRKFSANTPEHHTAVVNQLINWGLPEVTTSTAMRKLVDHTLYAMTNKDGTLKLDKLNAYANKEAMAEIRHQKRTDTENPQSRVKADWAARKEVKRSVTDAERTEGIRALMGKVSQPGGSFVFDRTRGVEIDSTKMVTSMRNVVANPNNTAPPVNVHFEYLHSNTIAVVNTGSGYRVMLKSKDAASLAVALNTAVPGALLSARAGISGNAVGGVILDFKDQAPCAQFLKEFMDPDSGLHKEGETRKSWMNADQIRFVNSRGVSVQASVTALHGLFTQSLGTAGSLNLGASVTLAAASGIESALESNAHSETATFSRNYSVSLTGAVSASTTRAKTGKVRAFPLNGAKSLGFNMTHRFKITTDPTGIMGSTCMETECSRGVTPMPDTLAMLPEQMRNHIQANKELRDKLQTAFNEASPSARIVVHYDLKTDVLEQVRSLKAQANHAEDREHAALNNKLNALLASEKSYEPTRISVQDTEAHKLGHNTSPSAVGITWVRRNSAAIMTTTNISLKP